MKILIIEDEVLLADSLKTLLETKGFEAEAVYDGESGAEYAELGVYDLLILDVMMPGLDGYQVARQVRSRHCGTPILMLTAKSDVLDRVEGLNSGADYYLTKPFDTRELLARIAVRLRESAAPGLPRTLEAGSLRLDPASHAVTAEGTPVRLTKTEYAILKLFLQNPGQAIAKSVILDRIAADTPDCTESSLKIHVSNLRKKLRDVTGVDYIESIWGIGFKLNAQEG